VGIDRFLEDLALEVEPFATCVVSSGWRLRMSDLQVATLHFVLRGEGSLRLAGGPGLDLRPYRLAVVPERRTHVLQVPPGPVREVRIGPDRPGPAGIVEHVAGIDGDRELLVACGRVRARYGGALPVFGLLDRPLLVDFSDDDPVTHAFRHLLDESTERRPGQAAMLRALMTQCLVRLLRRLEGAAGVDLPWVRATEDPRLAPVLDAILADPGASHSLESLAERASLSRSAFAEAFAAGFGRTPMAFVRDVRLQRAAELLTTTTLDVATIAHRVGFASRSHFSHAFRRAFSVPPAEHRRRARRGAP
jgi:AraC-like DNA-binding protein